MGYFYRKELLNCLKVSLCFWKHIKTTNCIQKIHFDVQIYETFENNIVRIYEHNSQTKQQ